MKDHYWEYCELCEHEVVICGKCGNNTCNGGYGTVDGKECDSCPSAYDLYLNAMKSSSKDNKSNSTFNTQYIEELKRQISAMVVGERTEKPSDEDIIAAFSLLIEYLEGDVE